jgi:hypothetical protein
MIASTLGVIKEILYRNHASPIVGDNYVSAVIITVAFQLYILHCFLNNSVSNF